MMRNIIRNWTACIGMVVTLAACDDYLDITPKGKALLKSTEDYLGLIAGFWPVRPVGIRPKS